MFGSPAKNSEQYGRERWNGLHLCLLFSTAFFFFSTATVAVLHWLHTLTPAHAGTWEMGSPLAMGAFSPSALATALSTTKLISKIYILSPPLSFWIPHFSSAENAGT